MILGDSDTGMCKILLNFKPTYMYSAYTNHCWKFANKIVYTLFSLLISKAENIGYFSPFAYGLPHSKYRNSFWNWLFLKF